MSNEVQAAVNHILSAEDMGAMLDEGTEVEGWWEVRMCRSTEEAGVELTVHRTCKPSPANGQGLRWVDRDRFGAAALTLDGQLAWGVDGGSGNEVSARTVTVTDAHSRRTP